VDVADMDMTTIMTMNADVADMTIIMTTNVDADTITDIIMNIMKDVAVDAADTKCLMKM
jgi:hypothetical protein